MFKFAGRSAEVLFDTGFHFKLDYLEDNKMKYTSLMEENKGKTETVDIFIKDHTRGIYSISWVEDTGTSVSHFINLDKSSVYAFMTWPDSKAYGGRASMDHQGSYKFIDGKDGDLTNRALVLKFWEEFFNEKNIDAADKYISSKEYLQHNPQGQDGLESFKAMFKELFKGDFKDAKFKVKHVVESEDLVGIHNHVVMNEGDLGFAAFDLFRVKDGKIIEHWDVLQKIDEKGSNKRPMF